MIDIHKLSFIDVHRLTFPFVPPQVIPTPELEKLLAGSVKYHAEHREALRTALKTYLNGGQAVQDGDKDAEDVDMNWNDTLEEEV